MQNIFLKVKESACLRHLKLLFQPFDLSFERKKAMFLSKASLRLLDQLVLASVWN